MREHIAVVNPREFLGIVSKTIAPRKYHAEEWHQVLKVSAAVRRRIALLHIDIKVIVAVPRDEPVVLEPRTLQSRGESVRIGHRAEAVHPVVELALQHGIRDLHSRALRPEVFPVVNGVFFNGPENRSGTSPSRETILSGRSHEKFSVGRPPVQSDRTIPRDGQEEGAAAIDIKGLPVLITRRFETDLGQLLFRDRKLHATHELDTELHAVRELHREKSIVEPRHRELNRRIRVLERRGFHLQKMQFAQAGFGVELAAHQLPLRIEFDDDTSERQHIGVARFTLGRILLEESVEAILIP